MSLTIQKQKAFNPLFIMLIAFSCTFSNLFSAQYVMKEDKNHPKADYFIKIAALNSTKEAKIVSAAADFPTQIIFMRDYYSVVSKSFDSKKDAHKFLLKIKKRYKNAYIITLYKDISEKRTKALFTTSVFQNALTLYKNKQYEEALALFDRILIEDPSNKKAALYYAKTLYKLKLYKEAKIKFYELLNYSQNKQEINKYIKNIEKSQKKHFFKTTLTVGGGYDDNINLNSDKETTKYGSYILQNDTHKTKSSYAVASFLLQHIYKADSYNIENSFYSYNELFHTAKGNDLNYLDFSTALSKTYGNLAFIFPVGLNYILLDSKTVSYNIYSVPQIRYFIDKKILSTFYATINDNYTKFAENRDYISYGGGIKIKYLKDNLSVLTDISVEKFDEKQSIRYDINKNLARFTIYGRYAIFTNLYFGAILSYENHSYRDLDSAMGYKREDDKNSLAVLLSKDITKNSSISTMCKHIHSRSNINVFDYKKNNCSFEYKYRF